MRTEQEMFDLILGFAKADPRVRAVYMNGSRANPNVEKDEYQDYDIVYVVTETASFLENKAWISFFGDIAMVQEPDSNDLGWGHKSDFSRSYTWLILFKDNNRLDLNIQIKEVMDEEYLKDSLTVPLLDKCGVNTLISTYRLNCMICIYTLTQIAIMKTCGQQYLQLVSFSGKRLWMLGNISSSAIT